MLADLHWLLTVAHIEYKIALLTFKSVVSKQSSYLHQLLHVHQPTPSCKLFAYTFR